MKRPKLLIIDKAQYGYLIDSYKWCEYLKEYFDITYLCYEYGQKKLTTKGINIHYMPVGKSKLLRFIRWNIISLWHVAINTGITIVIYQRGCSLLKKVFPWKKIIMDVRTLSVNKSENERTTFDQELRIAAKKFDALTVISQGVSDKIGKITGVEKHILPLGADVISHNPKIFDTIRLLYVGTLSGRKLERTLYGLKMWMKENPDASISYEMVGDGVNNELCELIQLSKELELDSIVKFYGRLPYDELKPFFDNCNIGVSFVPMTDYYNYQPPTKAYEYCLSGLYVVGTKTYAQQQIINEDNGILIDDSAESFCAALNFITKNLGRFDEIKIRNTLKGHTWKSIVDSNLRPFLNKFLSR